MTGLCNQLAAISADELAALRESNKELLAALKSVRDETCACVKPYSFDSYLPAQILEQVEAAIAHVSASEDTARMNAGFGEALELTKLAVAP